MPEHPAGADRLAALVISVRTGDPAAQRTLVEVVWPDAFRIARTVLHDAQLAEDVAQEACVQLLAKVGSLREIGSFRPWFYRLVTRRAYARLRPGVVETPLEQVEALPAVGGTGTAELLDLRRAIRALPTTLRLPLLFHYYLGLSDRETAQALGTTTGAVRVRLSVARRRLRLALQDHSPPDPTPVYVRQ